MRYASIVIAFVSALTAVLLAYNGNRGSGARFEPMPAMSGAEIDYDPRNSSRECDAREQIAFDRASRDFNAEIPSRTSRTNGVVALGRQIMLVGPSAVFLLDVDAKSVKRIDVEATIVHAERVGDAIKILTRSPRDAGAPLHVWSYSPTGLEPARELPVASCKDGIGFGGKGDTIAVFTEDGSISSSSKEAWHHARFLSPFDRTPTRRWFACVTPTTCLLAENHGEWGETVFAIGIKSGKVDVLTLTQAECANEIASMLADPTDTACALVVTGRRLSANHCVVQICGDMANQISIRRVAKRKSPDAEKEPTEDIRQMAAHGARLFAATDRAVYELTSDQVRELPLQFEQVDGVDMARPSPGLVAIKTGTALHIAVLDD